MDALECGICIGPFDGPVSLACGHSFCREHLREWLSRPYPPRCPLCNTPCPPTVPAVNIVLRDALSALVLVQERLQRPALAEIAEAELVFEGGGGAGGAGGAGGGAGALGAGAYGVVRHASWKGTPVAVKSLQRAAGDENAAAARAFDNEMRALAALHHPNIVHVFGTCHHADGRVSLVEDLAEGGDLYKNSQRRCASASTSRADSPSRTGRGAPTTI